MEWISVKDRLPEKFQDVLIWNETLQQAEIRYLTDEIYPESKEIKDQIVWSEQGITNNISHWMPLPEMPNDSTI